MKNIYILIIFFALNTLTAQRTPTKNCFPQINGTNTFTDQVTKSPNETTTPIEPSQLISSPPPSPPPAKDRLVYWVHGLGGNSGSWSDAATVSQSITEAATVSDWKARKIISFRPSYSQDFELEIPDMWDSSYGDDYHLRLAATQLRAQIDNAVSTSQPEGSDPNDNFIIAHSQGGLVASALLYNDNFGTSFAPTVAEENQNYGGLVLFSSSQGGAQLLNNKEAYKVEIAKDANSIGSVLDYLLPLDNVVINFFANSNIGLFNAFNQILNQGGCGMTPVNLNSQYGELLYNYINCFTASNQDPITEGYKVDAPELVEINSNIGNPTQMRHIPKVAFYGLEPKSFLIWRNLRWAEGDASNTSTSGVTYSPNLEHYFEANDDWKVKNKVEDIVGNFEGVSNFCDFMGDIFEIANPLNWLSSGPNFWHEVRNRCDDAVYTFNGLDYDYKIAIGAITYTTENQIWCSCMSRPDHVPVLNEYQINSASECVPTNDEETCFSYNNLVVVSEYHPNDGVVLAESVAATVMLTKPPYKMDDTSHMQARNNIETKKALNKVFRGDAGLYFKTTEK